jgi:RNA polymerase sigma-70 factor (ECF subfamily)
LDPAGFDDYPGPPRAGAREVILWSDPPGGQPFRPEHGDPAEIVASLEHVRLALIAGLRHLPPRQRAVLLMRDVLAWPAAEVGQVLDLSTPAVKSALQRARARLDEVAPVPGRVTEPRDPLLRLLLRRYVAAFAHTGPYTIADVAVQDVMLETVFC